MMEPTHRCRLAGGGINRTEWAHEHLRIQTIANKLPKGAVVKSYGIERLGKVYPMRVYR